MERIKEGKQIYLLEIQEEKEWNTYTNKTSSSKQKEIEKNPTTDKYKRKYNK